jgi:lipopolysaccharide transport system permease protein
MIVLNIFFGLLIRFDTGEVPYPLHLLTGLIVFQLFSKGLTEGANAISGNKGILSKVYIPPVVFPASSILSGLLDFTFPLLLLIGFLIYYQISPNTNLIFLPIFFLFLFFLFVAAQLFMSVTAMVDRDVKMIVPILSQLLFFGTPIFYPVSAIPDQYLMFFALNPMVGVIEGIRWSMLGLESSPDLNLLLISGAMTIVLLFIAIQTFQRLSNSIFKHL